MSRSGTSRDACVRRDAQSIATMAAILAAILIGAATGSSDAAMGGIAMAQGAAMQQQINFTRANENEADRVGMGFLAAAGFDPYGMPDFFETMGRRTGARHTTAATRCPKSCSRIPSRTNRIAESRSRAAQFKDLKPTAESVSYMLTRERLRVLATPAEDNVRRYYADRREQQDADGRRTLRRSAGQLPGGQLARRARLAHRSRARIPAGAHAAVHARPGADERGCDGRSARHVPARASTSRRATSRSPCVTRKA